MFTDGMNLLDLTVNQLKRAAAIKGQIEALNKELGAILGPPTRIGSWAKEKPDHERFCEKENCRCSKSKMGEGSRCQPSITFSQARREGREEDGESGN